MSEAVGNTSMAKREVHGVTLRAGNESRPKIVRETDAAIVIEHITDIKLSPASARHLARVLYRLARRVEARIAASAMSARSDETEGLSPQDASAVPQADAQPQSEQSA